MNQQFIRDAIESPTEDNIQALLDDEETVFWVDWREEDEAIVEYAESIIQTGELSAEVVDADNENGFEMFICYRDNRFAVPLVAGTEDRHITIVSLNEVLAPDYEIRFCIDSDGSDTLAFLPLPSTVWKELESQYGGSVSQRFYKVQKQPNLFTDGLSD